MATLRMQSERVSDTERLGRALAKILRPGMQVLLFGQLGAGKTTLARYIVRGLGVDDVIKSPTYVMIQEYMGHWPVYHMDLYRLEQAQTDELGLDEYLFGAGICLIEWPEQIEDWPDRPIRVSIALTGNTRRIEVEADELVIGAIKELL